MGTVRVQEAVILLDGLRRYDYSLDALIFWRMFDKALDLISRSTFNRPKLDRRQNRHGDALRSLAL
jgi:hypothetical protein